MWFTIFNNEIIQAHIWRQWLGFKQCVFIVQTWAEWPKKAMCGVLYCERLAVRCEARGKGNTVGGADPSWPPYPQGSALLHCPIIVTLWLYTDRYPQLLFSQSNPNTTSLYTIIRGSFTVSHTAATHINALLATLCKCLLLKQEHNTTNFHSRQRYTLLLNILFILHLDLHILSKMWPNLGWLRIWSDLINETWTYGLFIVNVTLSSRKCISIHMTLFFFKYWHF